VTETTVKRLLCCGFRRADKAMGQRYQGWWRIYREINVFSRFDYHMFYVLYPFVTYLLKTLKYYQYPQNRKDSLKHTRYVSSEKLVNIYQNTRRSQTHSSSLGERELDNARTFWLYFLFNLKFVESEATVPF
jgi:hypothetical protein